MTTKQQSPVEQLVSEGVKARESGDYVRGEHKLKLGFELALKGNDKDQAISSGNQLAIQYRLLAGRNSREGNVTKSKAYGNKSLEIYSKLENAKYLDLSYPATARNYSHAYLYAGQFKKALTLLENSLSIQTTDAARGDELCHLAAAYLGLDQDAEAKKSVTQGIALIESGNGSPIWLTFGLMVQASIVFGVDPGKARAILTNAHKIAETNQLAVRLEEIEFMLPQQQPNVLAAVCAAK